MSKLKKKEKNTNHTKRNKPGPTDYSNLLKKE